MECSAIKMNEENSFYSRIKGFSVGEHNHLMLNGVDLVDIAELSERPIYVFNELALRENLQSYRHALERYYPKHSSLFYASKAFLNSAMCAVLHQEGIGIDVCSEGELFIALKAKIPPEKIIMHGNNKSEKELRRAVTSKVHRIIVDNHSEFVLLNKICSELKRQCNVLIRINPCIEVDSHKYNATGVKESKFGFYKDQDKIPEYLKEVCLNNYIHFKGIHFHIGSNIHDLSSYKNAIANIIDTIVLWNKQGINVEELNIGGGLGIQYQNEDAVPDIPTFIQTICEKIKETCQKKDLELPSLMLEPGRSIVGEAGCTVYKMGSIKEGYNGVLYAAINGGMTDNIRPCLYQAQYSAVIANKMNEKGKKHVYKIVGKCCETGDVLIENIELPLCASGDVLVVFSTGAYNHSLANQYNKHTTPGVIFVRDGKYDWVSKEQPLEDLTQYDIVPAHLGESFTGE
jgi:diaminopimelate decarboxylase